MRQDPAVGATFTMTGNSQFLASNQGLLLAFLKPPQGARAHSSRWRAV